MFNQTKARATQMIEFRHTDGTIHGGVVGGTVRETFSVISYPRYGDTKSRTFRYGDVAEVISATPRHSVPLPVFDRLMNGGR